MSKGIARDWAWAFIGEAASRVGTLVSFLALFPLLGAAPSGMILAGYAYAMTAWLLVDLGLGFYGVKRVAETPEHAAATQAEVTVARLALALVVTPCLWWLLNAVLEMPPTVALCLAGFVLFRALSVDWRLRGETRFKALSVISGAASVAQVAALLVFVRADRWQATAALPWLVWALVMVAGTWSVAGAAPSSIAKVTPRAIGSHLAQSISFSLSNGASVFFGQAPIIALSLAFAPAQYAGFALVHRFVLSSNLFFQSLGAAVFPRIVRASRSDPDKAWAISTHAIRITLVLGSVIIVLFAGAYAIPALRQAYLPGVSLLTLSAMAAFLLMRSVRESLLRLFLARGAAFDAARIVGWALLVFLALLGMAWASGSMGVDTVAVAFAAVEAGILWRLLRGGRVQVAAPLG